MHAPVFRSPSPSIPILIILVLTLGICALPVPAPGQTQLQIESAQHFVEAFTGQNIDRIVGLEHPTLAASMSPERWKKLWSSLVEQFGPLQSTTFRSAMPTHSYASVVHRARFEKDSVDFRVVVDTMGLVGGFWVDAIRKAYAFPLPPYADTSRFVEERVFVGEGRKSLPGTVSIPKGTGPFPAVVLVHGSGPQDQDETMLANKPFRDIAWGLASRGVLVLRYMKRTKAYPQDIDPATVTVQMETVDDAIAAVRLLHARKDVDVSRLSVIGHSLGAMLAPDIAQREKFVTGIAMLASPARPLETLVGSQLTHIASLQDTVTAVDSAKLQKELEAVRRIEQGTFPPKEMFLGASGAYYADMHTRDPVAIARHLAIPILLLEAGRDYQVPMEDFDLWKEKLGGRKNVRFFLCERCFHLFIETDDRPSPKNYETEGHVALPVIDILARWSKRDWR